MRIILVLTAAAFGAILAVSAAFAEDGAIRAISDPVVKEECSACHFAFQPAFLPADSWQTIMSDLENHFGEDASLSDTVRDNIEAYLVANSGRGNPNPLNPPLRITELRWFTGEHSGGQAKRMQDRLELSSLLNCAACHRGAERGYYDDD